MLSRIVTLSLGLIAGALVGATGMYTRQTGHLPWVARTTSSQVHDHKEDSPGEHAEGSSHAGEEEDEHGHEEGRVSLPPDVIKQSGIKVAAAAGGSFKLSATLPGEIALNADHVAHLVPRVTGIVKDVKKNIGDTVKEGELLATLDSRELSEAKAADLAAEARLELARTDLERKRGLRAQELAAERQVQEAQKILTEAEIEHRSASAKLHALGFRHEEIQALQHEDVALLSRYEIRAPFAGTVVSKHITAGELAGSESSVFTIADLSTVWAEITIYPHLLSILRPDSTIHLVAPSIDAAQDAMLFHISPTLNENTRSGLGRALVKNEKGMWRPGMFISASLITSEVVAPLVVSTDSVQVIEGEPVVFVQEGNAFEKRPVTVGRSSATLTEIKAGLKPGEPYVIEGAFLLKAELLKGTHQHEH